MGNFIGRMKGSKNSTYRGVPVEEYRRARATMPKDMFDRWVLKVTGKPRVSNNPGGRSKLENLMEVFPSKDMELEKAKRTIVALGDALQKEQQEHSNTNLKYKECREMLATVSDELHRERNRSWISRLFNLKG